MAKKKRASKKQPDCKNFREWWDCFDHAVTCWMGKNGTKLLQVSLGIVFIWFGILKPLGKSPAAELVANTVYWVDPAWFVSFLGIWEVIIGLCLLHRDFIRLGIFLMAVQMVGTFLPLILLPHVTWQSFFVLTIEGQYIVKNLVLISAAIVVGSHVRDDIKDCSLFGGVNRWFYLNQNSK